MNENLNIFKAVQEKYSIVDVISDLGIRLHRVGSSLRADSIAGNGAGKDAFAVYEDTNTWHDFMLGIGGDITDIVAYVKYNGDKYKALCELMPECKQARNIARELSKREEFTKDIKRLSNELLTSDTSANVEAREYLHSRGITDETIKALQIGLDYGFSNQIRIRFPYWDMSGKTLRYYTTRAFKGDDANKYMKASLKAFPFLKNSPLGLNTVKQNGDFCIITEGMFDWLNCYQQGFAALAPNGTDFGKLWPEVLEVIKHHFKSVVLAFDSDNAGLQATAKAAEVLMRERIPFRVAQVAQFGRFKDLAEYCEAGKSIQELVDRARNGLKWYLDYIRPILDFDSLTPEQKEEALNNCRRFIKTVSSYTESSDIQEILLRLKSYFPKDWFRELCREAKRGLSEDDACEKVLEKHKLMYNSKVGFYEYSKTGIWEAKDDNTVLSYLKSAYGIHATGAKITSTLKLLKAHELVVSDKLINDMDKKCCVAFFNGTLHIDMKTGAVRLEPHSPDNYLTVRLPYFYNPEAKCPEWEKFIKDVTCDVDSYKKVMQEYIGYILLPECRYHAALLLKGSGSNGKSVFTNVIKALFGDKDGKCNGYISYAEPSKFAKDFRLMGFRNSWLNISSETESNMVGGEGVFKKLAAGEMIEDSYKHKDPFAFKPRTKLIMCCNDFPTVADTSEGFMRRWLIVPFTQHYVEANRSRKGARDKILDPHLEEKLLLQLSGIFNWGLEGLRRLISQDGFTETKDRYEQIHAFASANNHLYCFVDECFDKIERITNRTVIYLIYRKWADQSGITPIVSNRFYSKLKDVLETYGITITERRRFWTIEGYVDDDSKELIEERAYELNIEIRKRMTENPNGDKQKLSNDLQEIVAQHVNSWTA